MTKINFWWIRPLNSANPTWGEQRPDELHSLYICGWDVPVSFEDVEILSGPHTAHDIDIAYFGYWV